MKKKVLKKAQDFKNALVKTKMVGKSHPMAGISVEKLAGHIEDMEDAGAGKFPVITQHLKKITGTGGSSFGSNSGG